MQNLFFTEKFRFWAGITLAALMSLTVFYGLYGFSMLDPRHFNWVISGDSYIYFFGFNFFNQEAWHLPLGFMQSYSAPEGSSVVYTDSIPLLAILLKTLHIRELFQYQGFWVLLCFLLQGVVGFKLFFKHTKDSTLSLIGCAFLLTLPTFLMRGYGTTRHYSLLAHFLLLLGLNFISFRSTVADPAATHAKFRDFRTTNSSSPNLFYSWAVLLFLSLGIHFYLFLMILFFFAANEFPNLSIEKKMIQAKHCSLLVGLIFTAYLLGYFSIPLANSTAGGFGLYSMNLNAFINGMGMSRLPDLGWVTFQQLEGYQYLGAGLLIGFLIYLRPKSWRELSDSTQWVVLFLGLLALSFQVSLGSHIASEWITVPAFIGIFFFFFQTKGKTKFQASALAIACVVLLFGFGKITRASGRMLWPVEYLALLFLLKTKPKRMVLLTLLFVQLWDVSPLVTQIRAQTIALNQKLDPPLDFANEIQSSARIKHIALEDPNRVPVTALLFYALEHQLSMGPMILARAGSQSRKLEQTQLNQKISELNLDPQVLYLVGDVEIWQKMHENCAKNAVLCSNTRSGVSPSGMHYLYLK